MKELIWRFLLVYSSTESMGSKKLLSHTTLNHELMTFRVEFVTS